MPLNVLFPLATASFASILDSMMELARSGWDSVAQEVASQDLLIQLGALAGVWLLSYLVSLALKTVLVRREQAAVMERWVTAASAWLQANAFRALLVVLLWAVSLYFDALHAEMAALAADEDVAVVSPVRNYVLLRAAASLATLLLVLGALPRTIRQQTYFKTVFFILAIGLVLNLLGVWGAIRDGLDSLRILPVAAGGETRVTALTLVKGMVAIMIIIPLSAWAMRMSSRWITGSTRISPALQVLEVKVLNAVIVVAAILFGISSIGINLSSLAMFGGAIGLGLGFGFQKVVSNLISGVILLADRSIKPGDVIEVDDTYGWINKLSARYVSVITRDGMEHLIPNETLITEKVTNWSFSDDRVRVKIPFGVAYDADVREVMRLAVEAAKSTPRVTPEKEPVCWLLSFGENSIDFELRVWIRDPANGIGSLRSHVYVQLWEQFKAHNIDFPFPQRDLHIRGSVPLEVRVRSEEETF